MTIFNISWNFDSAKIWYGFEVSKKYLKLIGKR